MEALEPGPRPKGPRGGSAGAPCQDIGATFAEACAGKRSCHRALSVRHKALIKWAARSWPFRPERRGEGGEPSNYLLPSWGCNVAARTPALSAARRAWKSRAWRRLWETLRFTTALRAGADLCTRIILLFFWRPL